MRQFFSSEQTISMYLLGLKWQFCTIIALSNLISLNVGKNFNKAQFAKAEINLSEIMSKKLD